MTFRGLGQLVVAPEDRHHPNLHLGDLVVLGHLPPRPPVVVGRISRQVCPTPAILVVRRQPMQAEVRARARARASAVGTMPVEPSVVGSRSLGRHLLQPRNILGYQSRSTDKIKACVIRTHGRTRTDGLQYIQTSGRLESSTQRRKRIHLSSLESLVLESVP